MSLQSNEIVDRAIGMAFGMAIGDAKGIPFENLTREQIVELQSVLDGKKLLFADVAGRNPYIPKEWPVGRWGDTTQLSLAIMRAVVKHLSDDIQKVPLMTSIVDEHVKEWRNSTDGWGNATKSGIERIARGSHTYRDSGSESTGNGIIMKMMPLVFYFFVCDLEISDELIETICRMTHTSSVVVATACIYVHLCRFLFEHGLPSSHAQRMNFLRTAHELSLKYESKHQLVVQRDLLSIRIDRYMEQFDKIDDAVLIDVSHGGTYFCVDTLSMVIGLIAATQTTFETLVKASEMGGDTNIVAAMIGALLGAIRGQQAIDSHHIQFVYRTDYVRQVGEEFGLVLVQHLERFHDLKKT